MPGQWLTEEKEFVVLFFPQSQLEGFVVQTEIRKKGYDYLTGTFIL
jgi:hypothetical protein